MEIKTTKCNKCGLDIRNSNYKRHINVCTGIKKEKIKLKDEWLQSNGLYKCPYCNKEYSKLGIGSHIWKNHTEDGKKFDAFKDTRNWSKGLTKDTDERLFKSAQKISATLIAKDKSELIDKHKKWYQSLSKEKKEEMRKKQSNTRKLKYQQGLLTPAKGGGRGKHGWYKNYWCDSSWELAFVIYNLEHNIPFIRNTQGFQYQYNNEIFNYFPDFIMENGTYIEIKGRKTEQWSAKQTSFPYKLKILYKEEIQMYLDYVISKYGKDFITLYEDKLLIDLYELPCYVDYNFLKYELKKIENNKAKLKKQYKLSKLKNEIINSNIDFSKFGWVGKVSKIINITPQKVTPWMKNNMLEFYEKNCFKRK